MDISLLFDKAKGLTRQRGIPLIRLLEEAETLMGLHPETRDIAEAMLGDFIDSPPAIRETEQNPIPKILAALAAGQLKRTKKRNSFTIIQQDCVLPFVREACGSYCMDRQDLERMIADPRIDFYLQKGFAKLLVICRTWGIYYLKLEQEFVDRLLKASIPGIIATRILDLSCEHFDSSYSPMVIPLLSMYQDQMSDVLGKKFFRRWWPQLAALQAKADRDEIRAKWKIMPDDFYSMELLGNKGIASAILLIGMVKESGKTEQVENYIQIMRLFCAAVQLSDDLLDWREDLLVGRISLPLREALLQGRMHGQIDLLQLKNDLKGCQKVEDIPEKWEVKLRRSLIYSQATDTLYRKMDSSLLDLQHLAGELGDVYWKLIALLKRVLIQYEYYQWLAHIRKISGIISSGSLPLKKEASSEKNSSYRMSITTPNIGE